MAQSRNKRKNKNTIKIIVLFFVLLLAILFAVFAIRFWGKGNASPATTEEKTTVRVASVDVTINPLTGLSGLSKNAIGKRPMAVVISNAYKARPQWGLCSPDIIVEGMTEGGITRLLGLFADVTNIPKIGPMRSARHDFVEIAEGFDAIFVHWGGSIYAYNAMSTRGVNHIDGIRYSGKYFFRDKERKPRGLEHSGYTNGESIADAIERQQIRTQVKPAYASPFSFVKVDASKILGRGGGCTSVSFRFSNSYQYLFEYNPADGLYYNSINKKKMEDASGEHMAVTNVLLLYCSVQSMNDNAGCIDMNLRGGSGVYISNGTYETIRWEKGEADEMLKLYAQDGKTLILNTGKSYIGIVPASQEAKTVIHDS